MFFRVSIFFYFIIKFSKPFFLRTQNEAFSSQHGLTQKKNMTMKEKNTYVIAKNVATRKFTVSDFNLYQNSEDLRFTIIFSEKNHVSVEIRLYII